MDQTAPVVLSTLDAAGLAGRMAEMAGLLHACVHDGASVNFVMPFPLAEAEGFWRERVLPPLAAGTRTLWIAERGPEIAGTVMLDTAMPPNQPHRAEVTKLLVHPAHRRRGIARALVEALEARARVLGRTLITLDTRTGDAAEPLYLSLGYEVAGQFPGFSRDPFDPGKLDATTLLYKRL